MILTLVVPALALVAFEDPKPLSSIMEGVTLYASAALVHRTARVTDDGKWVIEGLPSAVDDTNVRVRMTSGEVVGVEVRARERITSANERVEALRKDLLTLQREQKGADDEAAVLRAMGEHLGALLRAEEQAHKGELAQGRVNEAAWSTNYAWLAAKLSENRSAIRTLGWSMEERGARIAELEREIGKLQGGLRVPVKDVIVDVLNGAGDTLHLEYLVGSCGWQPQYDLRAAKDLAKVDLSYRARVWQQSGEDWTGVQLALSTAQPQRGAQGPDPLPIKIGVLQDPMVTRGFSVGAPASNAEMEDAAEPTGGGGGASKDKADRLYGRPAARKAAMATVDAQGLSVRYVLPRKETIQSREAPTTVLVGEAVLEMAAERHVVPAVDTTVWLRGRTKNGSQWTLLPGTANVFLGGDWLGRAQLAAVQPGEEFTLHLGADDAIKVERRQAEDMAKGPGFFSSRNEKVEAWRILVTNNGAVSKTPDGAIDIVVREALPVSTDERISVEIAKLEPKLATDERWKKDLEEQGIRTWLVKPSKGKTAEIKWQTTISYPKDTQIFQH
jgi:uncharacterized protein (TIGR02231 family)